jgi:hypothetical protein
VSASSSYSSSYSSYSSAYAGGIVGSAGYGSAGYGSAYGSVSVSDCYNTGAVSASSSYSSSYSSYSSAYAGGILGSTGSGSSSDYGSYSVSISDCYNTGDISAASDFYNSSAGGIFGYSSDYGSYSVSISGCYNTGDISASFAGGILGSGPGSISISDCYNTGGISADPDAGGILGYGYGSDSVSISGCYNTGDISAALDSYNSYAGGILGYGYGSDSVSISDCYNVGDITAFGHGAYAGGISGKLYGREINNCYSAGEIYAETDSESIDYPAYAGGIIGYGDDRISGDRITIDNCVVLCPDITAVRPEGYWGDINASASYAGVGYLEGKNLIARSDLARVTTDDIIPLKLEPDATPNPFYERSTYENIGWDFDGVWKMAPQGGLPIPAWQDDEQGPLLVGAGLRIKSVLHPISAFLGERTISASTYTTTGSQPIEVKISAGAKWALYSDADCTDEIADKTMRFEVGVVKTYTAYIRLTAPDKESVVYRVVITSEEPPPPISYKILYHSGGRKEIDLASVYYDGMFDAFGATDYNPRASIVSAALSAAAYNCEESGRSPGYYITESLYNLGFPRSNIKTHEYFTDISDPAYGKDNVAYTFARKQIDGKTLVAVVIRGTNGSFPNGPDWASNFKVNTDGLFTGKHLGFNTAMEKVYTELRNYLGGLPKDGKTVYWITGHSRGAAVANLLSVKLSDQGVSKYNVYNYNFAVPDVEVAFPSVFNAFGAHDNIFNICNRNDLVSLIPGCIVSVATLPGTGWGKFGRTYWFSSGSGAFNHEPTIYLNHVLNNSSPGSINGPGDVAYDAAVQFLGTFMTILCPVDVEVIDKNGEIIAAIIDSEVAYFTSNLENCVLFALNDEKHIFLRGEDDYTLKLSAVGEGKMEYSVSRGNLLSGEMFDSKNFSDVDLFAGKKMTSKVNGTISTSDVRLLVLDAQDNETKEVGPDGTETDIGTVPANPDPDSDDNQQSNNQQNDGGNKSSGQSGAGITPSVAADENSDAAQNSAKSDETIVASIPFADVSESDWFYDSVAYVYTKSLFTGTSATTFSPNAPMTRAMLVTVLHRLAGEPAATGDTTFGDVPAGRWFTEAVAWASESGIVAGYGASVFGTNDAVTREQIAVLLCRYAEKAGHDVSAAADISAYTDAGAVSEWARDAVSRANAAGLLTGRGANTLAPADNATRAEVAAILHRFVEKTGN